VCYMNSSSAVKSRYSFEKFSMFAYTPDAWKYFERVDFDTVRLLIFTQEEKHWVFRKVITASRHRAKLNLMIRAINFLNDGNLKVGFMVILISETD